VFTCPRTGKFPHPRYVSTFVMIIVVRTLNCLVCFVFDTSDEYGSKKTQQNSETRRFSDSEPERPRSLSQRLAFVSVEQSDLSRSANKAEQGLLSPDVLWSSYRASAVPITSKIDVKGKGRAEPVSSIFLQAGPSSEESSKSQALHWQEFQSLPEETAAEKPSSVKRRFQNSVLPYAMSHCQRIRRYPITDP
jgi:hypothetical protein